MEQRHPGRGRSWLPRSEQARAILQKAAAAEGITLDPGRHPTADEAESLREALFDLLFRTGLEGDRPTPQGYLMETLIDGLDQYTDSDSDD
ncbi:hypothetical protein ACFC1R_19010 [Kitasatospora sp. NPDC056138]|uniref:hypothetical protein n=1 Tax=Kitasatospora sp. NPDC056138 TaxID=3345724 RepID=UPI0035D710A4